MPNGLFSARYCSNIIKCLRFYQSPLLRVLKRLIDARYSSLLLGEDRWDGADA